MVGRRSRSRDVQVCESMSWTTNPTYVAQTDTDAIEWLPQSDRKRQSWCRHDAVTRYTTIVAERLEQNVYLTPTAGSPAIEILSRQYCSVDRFTPVEIPMPTGQPHASVASSVIACKEGNTEVTLDVPLMVWEFKESMVGIVTVVKKFAKIAEVLVMADDHLTKLLWKETRGKSLKELRDLVKVYRPRAEHTLKQLSENWLLLQLGLAPTVSDCKGAVSLMTQLKGGVDADNRRNAVGNVVRASFNIKAGQIPQPAPSKWDRKDSEMMYIRGGMQTGSFVPADPHTYVTYASRGVASGRVTKRTDLTLPSWLLKKCNFGGPITFAWQAMRLSWLFDYFLSVGSSLALIDRYAASNSTPANEFHDGVWVSQRDTITKWIQMAGCDVVWFRHYQSNPPPYQYWYVRYRTIWGQAMPVLTTTHFARDQATPSYMLTELAQSNRGMRMSLVRLGTVAALWYSLWGPKSKLGHRGIMTG